MVVEVVDVHHQTDKPLRWSGGSGVVVLRYQIGTTERGTAKATGGQIATANGYIIHTFTGSAKFCYSTKLDRW